MKLVIAGEAIVFDRVGQGSQVVMGRFGRWSDQISGLVLRQVWLEVLGAQSAKQSAENHADVGC
jgi:hypothetical protein